LNNDQQQAPPMMNHPQMMDPYQIPQQCNMYDVSANKAVQQLLHLLQSNERLFHGTLGYFRPWVLNIMARLVQSLKVITILWELDKKD
jgi:hypothetical protein